MPCLRLFEMRHVAQRRLASDANSNNTNTIFFYQIVLRMGHDEFDLNQNVAIKYFYENGRRIHI